MKVRIGDRVTLPNHKFLSDGVVIKVSGSVYKVVKLDKPTAQGLEKVLMFESDMVVLGG